MTCPYVKVGVPLSLVLPVLLTGNGASIQLAANLCDQVTLQGGSHAQGPVRCRLLLILLLRPLAGQNVTTTFAGIDPSFDGEGRLATVVPIGYVNGVATDGAGNVYFTDPLEHLVLRVAPNGILSVIAGNGIAGYSGDGGPATSAALAASDSPEEYVRLIFDELSLGRHRGRSGTAMCTSATAIACVRSRHRGSLPRWRGWRQNYQHSDACDRGRPRNRQRIGFRQRRQFVFLRGQSNPATDAGRHSHDLRGHGIRGIRRRWRAGNSRPTIAAAGPGLRRPRQSVRRRWQCFCRRGALSEDHANGSDLNHRRWGNSESGQRRGAAAESASDRRCGGGFVRGTLCVWRFRRLVVQAFWTHHEWLSPPRL